MIGPVAFRVAAGVLPRVPARAGYGLAAALADLAHLAARDTRRTLDANLAAVAGSRTPRRERRRMSRLAFRNLFWGYFELFHLPGASLDELAGNGTVTGLEHLDAARRSGTGAVVVFAHSGNLEVVLQLAVRQPGPGYVVVIERMPDPAVHGLFRRMRESQGLHTVHADEPIELLRRFRAGESVILAGDLAATEHAVVADFFGRPARLPYGAVKLALRTGAPLLVVSAWREHPQRPARYRVRIDPPLPVEGNPNSPADVRAGVARLTHRLEEVIAARPEQWLAFRPIWSVRGAA